MSTPTSLRLSLVVLVVLVATVAQAAILTRAIEAQKSLVEREEQMLDQAKQQIQQKAQDAYDVSRGAVSSVADQLRYVVMYPWRMANEALEKPKLYAKYLLSKVPPVLSAEVTTPPPTTVALTEDTEPEVEPTSESNRLPLLVSSLQSLFNGDTTEDDLPQPNPYVEVIEIKYQGPKVVSSQTPEELLPLAETEDVEPTRDVLLA